MPDGDTIVFHWNCHGNILLLHLSQLVLAAGQRRAHECCALVELELLILIWRVNQRGEQNYFLSGFWLSSGFLFTFFFSPSAVFHLFFFSPGDIEIAVKHGPHARQCRQYLRTTSQWCPRAPGVAFRHIKHPSKCLLSQLLHLCLFYPGISSIVNVIWHFGCRALLSDRDGYQSSLFLINFSNQSRLCFLAFNAIFLCFTAFLNLKWDEKGMAWIQPNYDLAGQFLLKKYTHQRKKHWPTPLPRASPQCHFFRSSQCTDFLLLFWWLPSFFYAVPTISGAISCFVVLQSRAFWTELVLCLVKNIPLLFSLNSVPSNCWFTKFGLKQHTQLFFCFIIVIIFGHPFIQSSGLAYYVIKPNKYQETINYHENEMKMKKGKANLCTNIFF